MTTHAATMSSLLLDTSERGGSAASLLVVGADGHVPEESVGRRVARVRHAGARDSETHGGLGSAALDRAAEALLDAALADPRAREGLRHLQVTGGGAEIYLEVRRPLHDLVVVGAGHIAQPLARMGALLGFRVTVLDDRPEFATRERFPEADRVVRADFADPFAEVRIHERSHLLLVTRGHKYDYECLVRALRMDPLPGYIGMIGSRRRVRATFVQLVEDGIAPSLLERVHAPVGLDVGAETPEEIAVAVAAELVMVRRGGTGTPLRDVERIAERFFKAGKAGGR